MNKRHFILGVTAIFICNFVLCGCSQLSSGDKKKNVYFDRGMKYLQYKNFQSAAGEFEKAIQADPRCTPAHYQLGLACLKLNDARKAANELARVAAMQPDNLDATLKLAEILYQARRAGESLILINKILARYQNYPDALALLARIRIDEGRLDDAHACIEQAIAISPEQARYWLIRGVLASIHGNVQREEESLLKTVAMEPENQTFIENLVHFYTSHKQADKAIAYLEKVIERRPKWGRMHIKLSKILEEQNDFDKAAEHLIMVSKLETDNYTIDLLIGHLYRKHGKTMEAEFAYKKAFQKVQVKEGILEVKKVLADYYIDQKNVAQAQKIIDEIQVAYPKDEKGRLLKEQLQRMNAKS